MLHLHNPCHIKTGFTDDSFLCKYFFQKLPAETIKYKQSKLFKIYFFDLDSDLMYQKVKPLWIIYICRYICCGQTLPSKYKRKCLVKEHRVKCVRIRSYYGLHFPTFGLKRYGVSLHIQSEYEKIGTRIIPNTDTFFAVERPFSWLTSSATDDGSMQQQ